MVSPRITVRHAVLMVVAVTFCFLMLPCTASADPTDVVTLSFTGTVSCGTSCVDPISGTYSFDPDTDSIVGPWSFTSALGGVSSSGTDPFAGTDTSADQGFDGTFQLLDFVSGNNFSLQLAFNGADGFEGSIITNATSSGVVSDPSQLSDNTDLFDLLSGSTTEVVGAPEPSSITLLGLGLFGLLVLRRRRSMGSPRLSRS